MSEMLLAQYVKLAVRESQARVPTQLLQPDNGESVSDENDANELCGIAVVMGPGMPLNGQRKKTNKRKR